MGKASQFANIPYISIHKECMKMRYYKKMIEDIWKEDIFCGAI